jgi:phospholipid/cholesterol/gamma-HCH transport system substrate-binding protein
VDPPRLDLLLAKVEDLVNVAHAFLGDADQREKVASMLQTAGDLARTADQLLVENKESIPDLLRELSATAKDAKEVLAEAKALLAGGRVSGLLDDAHALTQQLRTEVPPLTADAKALTADAKVLLQSGKNLAGDFTPKDGAELKAAMTRFEAASAQLEAISTRADALLGQLESGKGTVGGLYQDPTVYQDLKALLHDLREHPFRTLSR